MSVKYGMVRISNNPDIKSKYNIYKLHRDGTVDGDAVYRNVTLAEGERITAVLNEWQPSSPCPVCGRLPTQGCRLATHEENARVLAAKGPEVKPLKDKSGTGVWR